MDADIKIIMDLNEVEPEKSAFAVYQNTTKEDEHILGVFENDNPICILVGSFVHMEALYITLQDYINSLIELPAEEQTDSPDKYMLMKELQKLYDEDQHCSGICDDCEYEVACIRLQPMLEDLFGYQG